MDEKSLMMVRTNLSGKDLMSGVDATVISESCNTMIRSSPSSQDVLLVQASSEDGSTLGSGLRKTVSILAITPTKTQHPTEATGATVFVGAGGTSSVSSANTANAPTNWRQTSIPEVQTVKSYGTKHQDWQKETEHQLHTAPVPAQGQQRHQQQSLQTHQTGQHVVKIRINPEHETSRVVSSIRLNPSRTDDGSVKAVKSHADKSYRDNDGTIVDRGNPREDELWAKAENSARLSGRIAANEPGGQSDSCVRINVVSGNIANKYCIDNNRENNNKIPQDHCVETAKNSDNRDPAKQQDEMIRQCAASNENINGTSINRGSASFYYGSFPNSLTTMMMSSGQCSPSDTLDSGTCSDLDGTPPPLPKKKNSSTVLLGVNASNGSSIIGGIKGVAITGAKQPQHNRAGSVTSSGPELDSDDNESNISCDSLNSSDLASRIIEHRSIRVNGVAVASVDDEITKYESHEKKINSNDIVNDKKVTNGNKGDVRVISAGKECHIAEDDNSHSMAARNNNNNNNNKNHNKNQKNNISSNKDEDALGTDNTVDREMNEKNNGILGASSVVALPTEEISASSSSWAKEISPSVSPSPSGASSLSKASSTPRARSPVSNGYVSPVPSSPMVRECTYEERKIEQNRINEENAAADYYANYNRKNGTKYLYDDDRFYEFHINENSSENENDDNAKIGEKDSNEYFAGYKILDREAIRSAKGTVRGVKNRVRAGIATFLQKPSIKNYKTKDGGKIVVYVTSMSIVRETYFACIKMLQILKTHMVKHEVRDLFMSRELQTELKERIGYETIEVPQLFIDGQYIGNVDTVERLNESGELRRMFKPYKTCPACTSWAVMESALCTSNVCWFFRDFSKCKSPSVCTTCIVCGGCRLLPCRTCNGSKKSPVRYDFMNEFCWLRCMNCDEVGLVRCTNC